MMRIVLTAAFLAASVGGVLADDTCQSRASDKKLAGAAFTSFMTKCRKDAASACDGTATGKKLAGAARSSFTKKCVTDAVGG